MIFIFDFLPLHLQSNSLSVYTKQKKIVFRKYFIVRTERGAVLQHLRDQVHQLRQGEVRGRVREDLSDCSEAQDLQPHRQDVQETSGQGLLLPDLSQ